MPMCRICNSALEEVDDNDEILRCVSCGEEHIKDW